MPGFGRGDNFAAWVLRSIGAAEEAIDRNERALARGGDAFREYSLPQAILKFKQGFGRLFFSS